ncbi:MULTISPECIES: amino acid ABC transporter permease [unclassified Acidovorax]|uniref:amino acid ABC transporter permease n=1 Tax=unclassified Acidovorax TaxID=2684926 RepID=UPI001C45AFA6|nr:MULTISPECIES: amino acid ABC transporter permease [unclassified Acidovorax]MBV7429397.1 amino acid ABC transporter permease [Acidovorax sp. sif0732]MBV7451223.1 amino acid ABC transporter permease [Acidovorax sp. sif0715]
MRVKLDFSVLLRDEYPQWILHGVITMFELTALAWLLAIAVGTVLAVMRMGHNRVARAFVTAYVEYHQNVPMLVQIFLWYFGIPALLPAGAQQWVNAHNSELVFATISIGLCMAAYVSEDLRGGIRAIPSAQMEAARALGLTYLQACRQVVLPQAVRIALPTLVSHTVLLFKNSSLAMTIGVAELTYATREIESQSFRTVEVYLFSTMFYLLVCLAVMAAGTALEARYRIKTR